MPTGSIIGRVIIEPQKDAPASVRCVVLTISDTRTTRDRYAAAMRSPQALNGAGHDGRSAARSSATIRTPSASWCSHRGQRRAGRSSPPAAPASPRATAPTKRSSALLDKRLDGFGELFRMLSYEQIGSAAMLSRACAGTIGASRGVRAARIRARGRLAMEKLILPEIGHVVRELHR